MAKPAITKRTVKGAALTYQELDDNFQNIVDSTLTLTGDTGGTAVTADLNGNITLVAGTGVTITGNNTAKTITINSSGGLSDIVQDTTPQLGGNLDTNSKTIFDASGNVKIADNLSIGSPIVFSISNYITSRRIEVEDSASFIIGVLSTFGGSFNGPKITFDDTGAFGVMIIGKGQGATDKIYFNDVINLDGNSNPSGTITNAQNGDLVYNTSTNKFQGYANGTWVNLH